MLLKKLKNDHFIKKNEEQKNQIIRPLVSFRMFQKNYEGACMIKFILLLIKYIQVIYAVFVKALQQIKLNFA